jgi:Holliday junction resolvase RusA-like endonuclease
MATRSSNQQASARRVEFFLPGAPLPAPRPRFRVIRAKSGASFVSTYYDKKYATFLKDAPVEIGKLIDRDTLFTGPVHLRVTFHIERPKSTKRSTPRYDIDNYLKSIMDAMTHAIVWHDDDQVWSVQAMKVFAPGEPGTHVVVTEAVDAPSN